VPEKSPPGIGQEKNPFSVWVILLIFPYYANSKQPLPLITIEMAACPQYSIIPAWAGDLCVKKHPQKPGGAVWYLSLLIFFTDSRIMIKFQA
jgi:hypothetical protein